MAEPCSTWVRETAHPKKLVYAAADFGKTGSKWAEKTIIKAKKTHGVCQSSGLVFKPLESARCFNNALGYFLNKANDVQHNAQEVAIFSVPFSDKGSKVIPLFSDNFPRAMSLFTARACIMDGWLNDKDEYIAPRRDDG